MGDEPGTTPTSADSPLCGAPRRAFRERRARDLSHEAAEQRRQTRRWSDDPDLKRQHEHLMVQLSGDLHRIRERAGWSLEDWARVSGVHPATIQALEQARTDPQISTLIRLLYPAGFTLQVGFRPGGEQRAPGPVVLSG